MTVDRVLFLVCMWVGCYLLLFGILSENLIVACLGVLNLIAAGVGPRR